MRSPATLLLAVATLTVPGRATAQDAQAPVSCRDRPCALVFDWTRQGGLGGLTPDRRYGNPAQLEEWTRAALKERGFNQLDSASSADLRIRLLPTIRNAMCDQMPGTSTDMSCRAVTEIQVRLEGPDTATDGIDLPNRLRNRCGSDQLMPTDKLAVYVAEYIAWALDGKAKGERRPVGHC